MSLLMQTVVVQTVQLQCHTEDTSCHRSGLLCPSLHSLQESVPQDLRCLLSKWN